MFSSFSGRSRKPRQVNLSGQNLNTFSATSWAPDASGTRDTVVSAHQDRQQRQQERKRINSAISIQKAWRRHVNDKKEKDALRKQYDEAHAEIKKLSAAGVNVQPQLLAQISRLNRFYSSRDWNDKLRLRDLAQNLLQASMDRQLLQGPEVRQLAIHIVETIRKFKEFFGQSLEIFSVLSKMDLIGFSAPQARQYYQVMSELLSHENLSRWQLSHTLLALKGPLSSRSDGRLTQQNLSTYLIFATVVLSHEQIDFKTDNGINIVSEGFNFGNLCQSLYEHRNSCRALKALSQRQLLLLLHRLIDFQKCSSTEAKDMRYIRALCTVLPFCANEIFNTIDKEEAVGGLPDFVKTSINTLVSKESIASLLDSYNLDAIADATDPHSDASMISSYALLLLRMFPTSGQDIRMWLYHSSANSPSKQTKVPAIKLFWEAMKGSRLFNSGDVKVTLQQSLRTKNVGSPPDLSNAVQLLDRDWHSVLLFLELYAFALRFTDDEEFLSGGQPKVDDPTGYMSRSRESSLPLKDVERLTEFLKDVAFNMYYYETELLAPFVSFNNGMKGDRNDAAKSVVEIADMSFDYVRTKVTKVLQMLYERDSRRPFLPKDHWLMQSRRDTDMNGMIQDIVLQDELYNTLQSEASSDDDSDDDIDMDDNQSTRSRARKIMNKAAPRIGPKLAILQHIPYVIPFETRVRIFRMYTHRDRMLRRHGDVDPETWRLREEMTPDEIDRHSAKIRRGSAFLDAFAQLYPLGDGLKEPLSITFEDQFGNAEAGIDGGGVTKEFLLSVTQEAFDVNDRMNMFSANDQNLLYPNPALLDIIKDIERQPDASGIDAIIKLSMQDRLKHMEFAGRIIGKCLYDSILIDVNFAGFFLLKWTADANRRSSAESSFKGDINDLRDFDEGLYQGLLELKNYRGDVSDFGLTFTIDDVVSMPGQPIRTKQRDLVPGGSDMPVTNENRVLYISLVARHRLYVQPRRQTQAFLKGLGEMISLRWLSMFNQPELQTLVSGTRREVDLEDLRRNTVLSGLYDRGDSDEDHPTIRWFWQVMRELDDSDRRLVLKYVTSTPNAPLLGFAQLYPRFSIRDSTDDEERLPSASTCVNLLKLPRYKSKAKLREKLLYAVRAGAGFDLS